MTVRRFASPLLALMMPLTLRRDCKNCLASLAAILVVALGTGGYFFLTCPLAPLSISASAARQAQLHEQWRNGNVTVLVRHAERCDHSDAPCLSSAQGITARTLPIVRELGRDFKGLGTSDVDIISSPLIRAVQTAENMFDESPLRQAWLFDCKGTMLSQVLRHKLPHHNLILVTHSECIQDLQSSMGDSNPTTPTFASSLFLIDDGKRAPTLLGYLDADEWKELDRFDMPAQLEDP